jgi:hypothetical protein
LSNRIALLGDPAPFFTRRRWFEQNTSTEVLSLGKLGAVEIAPE